MLYFFPQVRRVSKRALATLSATALSVLVGVSLVYPASAKSGRDAQRDEILSSRPAGAAVIAIVSLNQQRVTIYDADGAILRAPVSTGQAGYETPAGIYSVLEKKAEHYSNLYDDASMPFMQRITWSGIALHAGALPGYPASHGCIRMPHAFAERLFEVTKLGMRVIVVRNDVGPADIVHPALFKPLLDEEIAVARLPLDRAPQAADKASLGLTSASLEADVPSLGPRQSLRAIAAAKSAEADSLSKKADEARRAAAKKTQESARAQKALRLAQGAKMRAEMHLARVERLSADAEGEAATERAQEAKGKAQAVLAAAQARLEAVTTDVQPMLDLATRLRDEARAAEAAKVAAVEEAKVAMRKVSPVSVFVSRQMQRLYVRQARQPLFESPVAIVDPDRPLGTYVFTALVYTHEGAGLRWNVASMYASPNGPERGANDKRRRGAHRDAEAAATDVAGARSALDRVAIPKEAIDRISEVVSPGSTLIISDEGISKETGNGTDFIILMSGEPQGGIKMRRRTPEVGFRYQRPFAPYGWSSRSFWWQ